MEIMEISNRKLRQFGFWIIHWDQSGFRGQLIFFSKGEFKDWLDHGLTGLYVMYIYMCHIIFTLDSFDSF